MKKGLTYLLLFISVHCSAQVPNTIYQGLLEIFHTDAAGKKHYYIDPQDPKAKWYYSTLIKVEKDSVFVDMSPYTVNSSSSALNMSSGGFYFYKGTLELKNDSLQIYLDEVGCTKCKKILLSGSYRNKTLVIEGSKFVGLPANRRVLSEGMK